MLTPDDERYTRLAEVVLQSIPQPPDDYCEPSPQPLTPIPSTHLGAVLVQGVGSTSDPTDQERFYMGGIATLLKKLDIPYLVFSYKGHQDLNYRPWDTRVNIASISAELTHFVSAFPDGKVLVFAHSQGGNLVAFWACYHAVAAQLDRLAGTFFLACPLLQPKPPAIWEDQGLQKYRLWLDAVQGYSMDPSELAERLQGRFVIIRYWRDALARDERSSFLLQSRNTAPLSETIISNTSHNTICGHDITLGIVRTYIPILLL